MDNTNKFRSFQQSTPVVRRLSSRYTLAPDSSEESEPPDFGNVSSIFPLDDSREETELVIVGSSSSPIEEKTFADPADHNGRKSNGPHTVVMESLDSIVPGTPQSSLSSPAESSAYTAPRNQAPIDYSRLQFTQFRGSPQVFVEDDDNDDYPVETMPSSSETPRFVTASQCVAKELEFEAPESMSIRYLESSSDGSIEIAPDSPITSAGEVPTANKPKDDSVATIRRRKEELERVLLNLETATRISEHLPDSGQRLNEKIASVRTELKAINTRLADNSIEVIDLTKEQDAPKPPKTKGPILRATDNVPFIEMGLPQTRAEVDQFAKLLTGKIAQQKLNEVRAITLDTVARIHSAMQSRPQETDETDPPAGLNCPLMLHQRQALTWLLWREEQVPSGGILADDMGLGKTYSMLSLIMASKNASEEKARARKGVLEQSAGRERLIPSQATLVVCPASILHQWESEVKKRLRRGVLRVEVHHGSKRENQASRLARNDIVLTTYGIVHSGSGGSRKAANATSPLFSIMWNRIILDEAHTIKTPTTGTAQACYKLEALSRWALTGTPIHNDIKDLFSLLKFLRFRPFDDYQVWRTWMEVKTDAGIDRIHSVVRSILLRRTKDQLTAAGLPLVPLPPKTVEVQKLNLTGKENDVYMKMFAASRLYVENFLAKGDGGGHDDEQRERLRHANPGRNVWGNPNVPTTQGAANLRIIVMLLRLRQACCHLSLLRRAVDMEALRDDSIDMDIERHFRELSLDEDLDDLSPQAVDKLFDDTFESCKVKALIERIVNLRRTESEQQPKFVVVSEWVELLRIVGLHLNKNGITFTSITGKIIPEERTKRVESFNRLSSGPEVMLLSLTAGGVGLNLIGGNHLFILDPHWNPALEVQAADRIYRVGQIRPVVVHKLVCVGTVEERVVDLQERKLQMAQCVLTGVTGNVNKALSLNDLRFLFELDNRGPRGPPNFN